MGAYQTFDPLLSEQTAQEMMRVGERFGTFPMYVSEQIREGLGQGLTKRHDAAMNFVQHGGRFSRDEPFETLVARTNLFRGTYALGDDIRMPGVEPLLNHEGFYEAARSIVGGELVVPTMLYANLLLPGQELAVHTDTPEYRGMSKQQYPEWLMVVMYHSGLFESWRVPIVGAVAFFGGCDGGEFILYPDGPRADAVAVPAKHNTGVIVDVDDTFHAVDTVGGFDTPPPPAQIGMAMRYTDAGNWRLGTDEDTVGHYAWGEFRYSIQWKAYVFRDTHEKQLFEDHSDDLSPEYVREKLIEDLRRRERIGADVPDDTELALLMMDEYIQFPA